MDPKDLWFRLGVAFSTNSMVESAAPVECGTSFWLFQADLDRVSTVNGLPSHLVILWLKVAVPRDFSRKHTVYKRLLSRHSRVVSTRFKDVSAALP